jgi:putative spermidine/putrescine transport system permease protein
VTFDEAFFRSVDPILTSPEFFAVMKRAGAAVSDHYLLAAFDLQKAPDGKIVAVPEESRLYIAVLLRTLQISALVMGACLVLGFPVAVLLATSSEKVADAILILVMLPFWTSLLVRTTAWIVLLQKEGIINSALLSLGLISEPLTMIFNRMGVVIAMTHVLLPFMILPLYSVMRVIPPSYARAARSLGATSWTTFRRVYLPQTLPGIGAGSLLVFILAVGYYITPALVGGADGQLISNLIDFHMDKSNWSLAAALSAMLLVGVLILYWLYDRLVGIDRLKLG